MDISQLSPDEVVLWQAGPVKLNATLLYTWATMFVLTVGSWWLTRNLSSGPSVSRWQNLLEVIIDYTQKQIREISRQRPEAYLPFIATLFLFIAFCNAMGVVPGYLPPTASLSTTAALAICVFFAVPIFGILNEGIGGYLRHYIHPSPVMLPFQIIGELSRTLALAVRLFGNVMSGTKIVAILLALAPLFFPIVMQALGLLTGLIQAYIFAILSMVYMASGVEAHRLRMSEESSGSAGVEQPGEDT